MTTGKPGDRAKSRGAGAEAARNETPSLRLRPLTAKDWPVIEALFGERGACAGCWCMWWHLPHGGKLWKEMRGPRNKTAFKKRVLGGEVGATRPCVQAGWVEAERQVGQTGKTVRPKLYIAAGISGAIQHRVGMEASDVIVAINTDPNAPIFDFAHHGIVGNAMQVLPVLTQAFRSHLDKRIKRVA